MRQVKRLVVAAVLVALLVGTSQASVFFAGRMEKGEFVPEKGVKAPFYGVRYSTVDAVIADGRAKTTIEEHVTGPPRGEIRAVCLVPLPEGVDAKNVVLESKSLLDGNETSLLSAGEARAVYASIAKATGSAKVMALAGKPALMASHVRLGLKNDFTVRFTQPVADQDGLRTYACPVPETGFAIAPVERLTVNATVQAKQPLRGMFSPTHEANVERSGLNEARVRVAADHWFGGGMFKLIYVADDAPLGLRVLAHREKDEDEGYFIIFGNPTGSPKTDQVIEKDVLLVLDTSGSMRGEKMEQARAAIEYCLKNLGGNDRFNIVTFGTEVKSFRDDLAANTPANVKAASVFVDEIVAVGRTNISGALAKGLAGKPSNDRPRMMIFLTDGTPTAGERVPEKIVKSVPELNTSKTRVFVMGIGHDVNAYLLDRLAEETQGSSEYVGPDEEIDVRVAALYNRLSHPVLTNVEVAFGDLPTHSVYPRKVGALFRGSPVMIAGRYRGGGKHTITIKGTLAGKPKEFACTAEFPKAPAPEHEFVASLWATRKVGFLLEEIRLRGENKEVIEEIVRLAKKFGIVTEYTAFIARAGGVVDMKEAARRASEQLGAAREEQAGKGAVNDAINARQLQGKTAAPAQAAAPAVYRDKRGRMQEVANVRNIGRRTFYRRDGRWVDADEKGDRKVKEVKLFSEEYFELVKENEAFRKAQSMGADVEMNVGDVRVRVKK
jgi:Ca-activated chloride channel family protein